MRKVLQPVFAEIGPGQPSDVVETSSMMTMIALLQESDILAVIPADVTDFNVRHGLCAEYPSPSFRRSWEPTELSPAAIVPNHEQALSPFSNISNRA